MGGFSEAATGVLSVLEVRGDSLHFLDDEGAPSVAAATSFLGARDGESAIAAGGQSFAAAASMQGNMRVELRRVEPPAPVALCGGEAPASHVALVYADPLTVMSVVVFSGPDAPGPNARDSVLCATYQYAVD
jgi:hypothetical protein